MLHVKPPEATAGPAQSALRIGGMAANGKPPTDAVTLYRGDVMHARLNPFGHRFTYRVFNILIDLDRLDQAGRASRLFSVNRNNLVSFHETDHLMPGAASLRAQVDEQLAAAGVEEPAVRVLLLAYPRILGYVFNPISVYFALDAEGLPIAAIYEVRNTFGQRHSYVARVEKGELSDAGLRQHRTKLFHVSPFVGMEAAYDFRVLPPGRALRVRIMETEAGKPLLAATLTAHARPMSGRALVMEMLRAPLMTLKVVGGIHYEALKLWLKGARYHPIPEQPPLVSHVDGTFGAPTETRP
jgi:uncharacterized protein